MLAQPPSTIDCPFSSRFTILRDYTHRIEKRRNPPSTDDRPDPKFFPSIFLSIVKIFQRGKGGRNVLNNSKVSTVKLATVLGWKSGENLEFCVTLLIPRLAEASCWTRPGLIRESVVFARCRVEIISRTRIRDLVSPSRINYSIVRVCFANKIFLRSNVDFINFTKSSLKFKENFSSKSRKGEIINHSFPLYLL